MMGPRQEAQPARFYEFSPEDHVPRDHLLRSKLRLRRGVPVQFFRSKQAKQLALPTFIVAVASLEPSQLA
jgi:hypothetical protein